MKSLRFWRKVAIRARYKLDLPLIAAEFAAQRAFDVYRLMEGHPKQTIMAQESMVNGFVDWTSTQRSSSC